MFKRISCRILVILVILSSCSPSLRIKRSIQRVNRLTAIYPDLADTFNLKTTKQIIIKQVSTNHTYQPNYIIKQHGEIQYIYKIDTLKTPYLAFKDTTFTGITNIEFFINDSGYVLPVTTDLTIKNGKIITTVTAPETKIIYSDTKTVYKYTLKRPYYRIPWFWAFVGVLFVLVLVVAIMILMKI